MRPCTLVAFNVDAECIGHAKPKPSRWHGTAQLFACRNINVVDDDMCVHCGEGIVHLSCSNIWNDMFFVEHLLLLFAKCHAKWCHGWITFSFLKQKCWHSLSSTHGLWRRCRWYLFHCRCIVIRDENWFWTSNRDGMNLCSAFEMIWLVLEITHLLLLPTPQPFATQHNAHIRQTNRMNCVKTNIVSLHVISVVFALDTSITKTLEDVGNKNGAERFSFHSTDFDEGTTILTLPKWSNSILFIDGACNFHFHFF